jgi:hypothetical protein
MKVQLRASQDLPVLQVYRENEKVEDPNVDVPTELIGAWLQAQKDLRAAEDNILRHVLAAGQKAPLAFSYREGLT